ncbi:adenylyl-sulfate kinase [Candidatus Pantoea carbekii]|uniref:Adenylyl-sulfate kinase n=1 Tax=Candidatus Pantoea carbekii TaxID=1235990 RepID=U3U7D5_9GAMM|nr:adenylyl-sulfate kinase [Candidatus Pantoea carbekii]AKC32419.1 adenylyl-sulfate kinase CysC [Candidatus Pantoea carbekii]BAO00144.1 adenylyl-sulfate kinase [Candidatus Pantoea carbekii]
MKLYDHNLVWHKSKITRIDREYRHGHQSILLWFTGLSGSGKSTLANSLEQQFYQLGISTYLIDGDNIRHGLCRDLGFSNSDRKEHIRRVGEVAKLMVDAGLVVLVACISPFSSERKMVRNLLGKGHFIEIYVDTPLQVCEERDPKNLYKKARSGQLLNFTGLDSLYEIPNNPEIHVDGEKPINVLNIQVLNFLRQRNIINF